MRKVTIILLGVLAFTTQGFGQTKPTKDESLKAHIIALDIAGWEAWKNKDVTWFQDNTAEDFISISAEGISNRAEVIKSVPVDCDIKSYSLDDFKFMKLNKNTVVIIYIATQDGTCSGKKMSAKVQASVTYVKRAGKWLEAVYMETTITP